MLNNLDFWLILLASGFLAGGITGLLGMGGSLLLVPIMMALQVEPVQTVGTSSLAMFIVTVYGSLRNWRSGNLLWQQVLAIGLPALITAQLGVYLARIVPREFLLGAIAILIVANIYFSRFTRKIKQSPIINYPINYPIDDNSNPIVSQPLPKNAQWQAIAFKHTFKYTFKRTFGRIFKRTFIGMIAGLISGLMGISGGVVIVPSQILLLQTEFVAAVQTSVGVMILSTGSAFIGHQLNGHVLVPVSLMLGATGILGIECGLWLLANLRNILTNISYDTCILIISLLLLWRSQFIEYKNIK